MKPAAFNVPKIEEARPKDSNVKSLTTNISAAKGIPKAVNVSIPMRETGKGRCK
ncbi:hypothetical protein [Acidocella sp.]|uniref:hypothetical protein n=1 Tax=Acidocella sp. TaxID=50710 RepID=UPI003CFC7753